MAIKMEKTRVNLNMPNDTLKQVDAYAAKMSINRTAAIMVLLNLALDSKRAMSDLSELLVLAKAQQNETTE